MPKPRISRSVHRPARQPREGDSAAHVAMVRRLPCCVTGFRHNVDAHHLLKVGDGLPKGMSRRNEDKWVIPLHHDLHMELHDRAGNEEAFLAGMGIDGRALARALWANRGDLDACERIIFNTLQRARIKA